MSLLSKTGLAAALLLFLSGAAPNASAQQNGIPCPLGPQASRTLVLFGTTSPIVASETLAEATTGSVAVSLPAGIYNITASSFDAHSTRQPPQNQTREQFYLRLSNGQTTNRISDLPEDSDSLIEQIDADFAVTSAVISLIAQHTEYPDPGVPNSIIPVCVAFDDVSPTPSPTPTPPPQESQDDPGDEADCCPGPDPEPEQTPAPTPRVAGIQSKIPPAPSPSPSPSVASAIANFPSAGPPFKPAAWIAVLLLAALLVVPAAETRPDRS